MRLRLRPAALTTLAPHQSEGLLRLCARDPHSGVALAQQLLRWETWDRGDVVALGRVSHPSGGAWVTGSLVPFGLAPRPQWGHRGVRPAEIHALAAHARERVAVRGAIFGPASDVCLLWQALAHMGVRAREERCCQPLLTAPNPPYGMARAALAHHRELAWVAQQIHPASAADYEIVMPACVAMFREELGYDPTRLGKEYGQHVQELLRARRTYVVYDDGAGGPAPACDRGRRHVAFKVDVGSLWWPAHAPAGVCHLTGVWTRPDLRGRGIASVALSAAIDAVRRDHVGANGGVSLYVNDTNTAARRLYDRIGMRQIGTFATVLL